MSTTFSPTLSAGRQVNVIWSNVALVALAIIGAVVHSYNMFGFPLYLGDEGIYMAQAYAVVKMNSLTPYTYWYDHAPAGWLLIALWSVFTGGFFTFGTAIDGGRVLMLLLHLASLMLLFRVVLQLSGKTFAATAAGLLYTLSPLSVIYGRMVLLDNIMVFWVLLAITLLLESDGRLWPILGSALCFGLAVLTKESAIFLLPAFFYALWTLSERYNARFVREGWIFVALSTISLYFLYAALRKELVDLSLSSPLAGNAESVTLLGSLFWQVSRGGGAPWDTASDFYRLLSSNWLAQDPWLIGLGAITTGWNLITGDHRRRFIALLSLGFLIGIARGGVVLEFYILGLLPLLALNLGLAVESLSSRVNSAVVLPVAVALAALVGWVNLSPRQHMFTLDLTTIQRQALAWVQAHVPANAQIIGDDDLWVDLRAGAPGKPAFAGAHSHWKVASDPAVHRNLFYDDWRNLDYLILTPGMDKIFERLPDALPNQAYVNSTSVAKFSVGDATVEVRRVNHAGIATKDMLDQSYRTFRDRFISNGQVRTAQGFVDARDQSAALLMAVWMDDRKTFDELWQWTEKRLLSEKGLLYQNDAPGLTPRSTTDANTDAALALLLAERRWNDASYGRSARALIQAIWEHTVVKVNGVPYIAAGDWAISDAQVIFAPGSFAPYAYHVFASVDTEHDWWFLLDANYKLLEHITKNPAGEGLPGLLPPAYVGIDRTTGELLPAPISTNALSTAFDENAAQVYWRVGLDAQWHDDKRADAFLKASRLLDDEWQVKGQLATKYSLSGTAQTDAESLTMYSAVLPKFIRQQPALAQQLFATKLATAFTRGEDSFTWGDGSSITEERWAWLATALYADILDYRWENPR